MFCLVTVPLSLLLFFGLTLYEFQWITVHNATHWMVSDTWCKRWANLGASCRTYQECYLSRKVCFCTDQRSKLDGVFVCLQHWRSCANKCTSSSLVRKELDLKNKWWSVQKYTGSILQTFQYRFWQHEKTRQSGVTAYQRRALRKRHWEALLATH